MKTLALSFFLALVVFVAAPFAQAQSATPIEDCLNSGGDWSTDTNSCVAHIDDPAPEVTQTGVPSTSGGFVPLTVIPGLTDMQPTAGGLADFFNNLYKYLIGLSAILAIIMIIWGGLEISTQDSVSKNQNGKERIYNAIFGLVLVLSPVLVFSIINPSILNLSLNLPALDTKTGDLIPSGTGVGDAAGAEASGCSVSLNDGGVGCSTQQAANDFAASCTNGPGKTFLTNDSSVPYGASCNALASFAGGRNYTNRSEIPQGYWCYTTTLTQNGKAVINYSCQTSEETCNDLILNHPAEGQYRAGCLKYPN